MNFIETILYLETGYYARKQENLYALIYLNYDKGIDWKHFIKIDIYKDHDITSLWRPSYYDLLYKDWEIITIDQIEKLRETAKN